MPYSLFSPVPRGKSKALCINYKYIISCNFPQFLLSLPTGDDSVLGKNYESKISTMMPLLNEKQKRIYLASEAIAIGRGGVTEISRISGISRSVITAGIKDINDGNAEVLSADAPIRRKGAGRKPITETQPGITEALEKLV